MSDAASGTNEILCKKAKVYLEQFTSAIRGEFGLSHNTLLSYASDLEHFIGFTCNTLRLHIMDIAKSDIVQYLGYLKECEMSDSSIARKVSSITRFFYFLVSEKIIKNNPMIGVSFSKNKRILPKYVLPKNIQLMVDVCKEGSDSASYRDALIIQLLCSTGLRVSELVSLRLQPMMSLVSNGIDALQMITVMGKGSKERLVPLKKSVIDAMKVYFENCLKDLKCPSKFLFPSRGKSGHLTRESIGLMIKKRALQAGLSYGDISPHVLRHSFATDLCKENVNLRFVQELLGHASISTTEIYVHTVENEIVDFVDQCHPLGDNN